MSNELVVQKDSLDLAIHDLEKTRRLCHELMKTPHYAKMGDAGIFAITEKAKQIGMSPLEALNGGMYFVNGKVEMQGAAMLALIRKHGHSVVMDPKSTNTSVVMHGKRADNGDTWTVSFSIQDAKTAGIYKNVWEKYPQDMCCWRCVSKLGRFLFSDILKGCYVVGEISDAPPLDSHVQYEVLEAAKVETINAQQSHEICELLELCSPEIQKKVRSYYSSQKVDDKFSNLPISAHAELMNKLNNYAMEFQQSMTTVEVEVKA